MNLCYKRYNPDTIPTLKRKPERCLKESFEDFKRSVDGICNVSKDLALIVSKYRHCTK